MPEAIDLGRLLGMDDDDDSDPGSGYNRIEPLAAAMELRQRWNALNVKHYFAVGELVQWKDGLKNRRFPGYGVPMLVLEVVPDAEVALTEPDKQGYAREPMDVVVGLYDGDDGTMHTFGLDSRRLEPFSE